MIIPFPYPQVLDEHSTVQKLIEGCSIARYGDGEFKLALGTGRGIKSQTYDPVISTQLRLVLQARHENLIIGIPRLTEANPKNQFWINFMPRVLDMLDMNHTYGSSLITRTDNCPWIKNEEYFTLVEKIWEGKKVVYVSGGSSKSYLPNELRGATNVEWITSLDHSAWSDHERVFDKVLALKPDITVLSLGPTATVLSWKLAVAGIQAIDIGHLGGFVRRARKS